MDGKVDGLILDVDGTLWDSTFIVAQAWERAIYESGLSDYVVTPERLKGLFGKTMTVIAEQMFPELPLQKRNEIIGRCCAYEHEDLEKNTEDICYPGVVPCIRELSQRFPVFIVSNCQSGYIELFLKKTQLGPYVTDTECFGNTQKSKGENIALVVDRNLLLSPVYVGDTQGDCDAAAQAGVPFVFASYGFGEVNGHVHTIAAFSDLKKFLEGGCRK